MISPFSYIFNTFCSRGPTGIPGGRGDLVFMFKEGTVFKFFSSILIRAERRDIITV